MVTAPLGPTTSTSLHAPACGPCVPHNGTPVAHQREGREAQCLLPSRDDALFTEQGPGIVVVPPGPTVVGRGDVWLKLVNRDGWPPPLERERARESEREQERERERARERQTDRQKDRERRERERAREIGLFTINKA